MKSLALSAVALAASLSATLADINVVSPWSDSAWKSGGNGTITWNITPEEENMKCEIQLLNGDTANSNIVAYVTDPGAPVPCSDKAFNIEPLNDFAKGKYWIRIGHPGEKKWFYSHAFEFDGKGTAEPLVLAVPMPASSVSKPTAIPTAAVSSSAALKTASSAAGSAKFTLSSKSGGAGTHATAGPASENNKEANAKSAESSAAAAGKQQSTWMLALAGVAAVAAYSF